MRLQAAALALVLTALALCAAAAQAQGGARDAIAEAYRCIVKLHEAGGNVTALVERLNYAIDVAGENPEEAARIAFEIVREYPRLVAEAVAERNRWYAALAAACCAAGVAGYLCYRYLPAAIWTLWLRMRRGDVVVVRRERAARKSMYASEEVRAVALAVVVVLVVFAVAQAYMAGRVVEPFSELALLGRRMKIADYPRELVVGEPALFYVYVGNHMGYPVYYQVRVIIGNRSTPIDPAPLPPVLTRERVLLHNETWIFPVTLVFNRTGTNIRVLVELWIYNLTTGKFQYHHRWTQLWINVTSPP